MPSIKRWGWGRKPIKSVMAGALVPLLVFGALHIAGFRLVINSSHSLGGYVYLVEVGNPPQVGEYIAFKPPKNPFMQSNGFLKIVGGIGGDVVTREGHSFSVNGHYIGVAKEQTLKGLPLEPGPEGVICDGCYFVYTQHKDSFDSRYSAIGWIVPGSVIGRAYRIF